MVELWKPNDTRSFENYLFKPWDTGIGLKREKKTLRPGGSNCLSASTCTTRQATMFDLEMTETQQGKKLFAVVHVSNERWTRTRLKWLLVKSSCCLQQNRFSQAVIKKQQTLSTLYIFNKLQLTHVNANRCQREQGKLRKYLPSISRLFRIPPNLHLPFHNSVVTNIFFSLLIKYETNFWNNFLFAAFIDSHLHIIQCP